MRIIIPIIRITGRPEHWAGHRFIVNREICERRHRICRPSGPETHNFKSRRRHRGIAMFNFGRNLSNVGHIREVTALVRELPVPGGG